MQRLGSKDILDDVTSAMEDAQLQATNSASAQAEIDEMEQFIAETVAAEAGVLTPAVAGLKPIQVPTQADATQEEPGMDDGLMDKLNESYPSQLAKNHRLKDLSGKMFTLEEKAGESPFDVLNEMRMIVDEMPESDDKVHSAQIYNIVDILFAENRTNAYLRDFLARVFIAQQAYYDLKEEKAVVKEELKMLTKLYYDQQREQLLKDLEEKQRQAQEKIERDGKARSVAAAKSKKKEEESGKIGKRARGGGNCRHFNPHLPSAFADCLLTVVFHRFLLCPLYILGVLAILWSPVCRCG
jgi:hypothetical protein